MANVRLGKGSVKSIWRGSARWPAPGEALLSTPAARVDCKFSGGALSGQHSWEAQQLELTVNSRVPRSWGGTAGNPQQLELTVNYRVPRSWGGPAGNPQQLELTVNYRVPRSRGGTASNPPQLELTVNYRVPRSRVGGSQNVANLPLEPK